VWCLTDLQELPQLHLFVRFIISSITFKPRFTFDMLSTFDCMASCFCSVVQHLSQSSLAAAAAAASSLPITTVFGRSEQPWGQPWQGSSDTAGVSAASLPVSDGKRYVKAILLKVPGGQVLRCSTAAALLFPCLFLSN
jgi:hypothetical protein